MLANRSSRLARRLLAQSHAQPCLLRLALDHALLPPPFLGPPERLCSASRQGARGFAAASRPPSSAAAPPRPSGSSLAIYLSALVVGMVGATYASVPLYRLFCQATGYGGTTQRVLTVEDKVALQAELDPEEAAALRARPIKITFNADVADGLPWSFVPSQRSVTVTPGESALAFYTATNRSDAPVVGVSTYNVTPMRAGLYFNKVQCFCFEEQRLLPGETLDMPVLFYLDPEFAKDPRLANVQALTLSYTFFRVDGREAEARERLAAAAARDVAAEADKEEAFAAA